MKTKLTLVLQKRGRWYIAYVKDVLGVNTQGRRLAAAGRNLDEAVALVIATNRELSFKSR
jgi:predicted RNase H-like HicB family nuclease